MPDRNDLILYHIAPSRSSIVLWTLEEIGEPYDVHLLNFKGGEHHEAAYLAINPMGKAPALDHRGVIITEGAAICCYLAETFPQAGLQVPPGDARRAGYLKWLFFSGSCLDPAMVDKMSGREPAPPHMAGWGDFERVIGVITTALAKGPYLLGDQFTAADIVIGAGLHWGLMFGIVPQNPEILAYTARLQDRPAFKRMTERDEAFAAAAAPPPTA
jgi:glutathione S-transferase